MTINCNALAPVIAVLITEICGGMLHASSLQFGVVGSPIDLSANVSDAIIPGSTVFQQSNPLFGTAPDPKQSAELLHNSTGINPSDHSTISSAFASSLAESDGNGGVGVSQIIFGSPGGTGQTVVRQLVAQSLWTQTFVYNGSPSVALTLHLQTPALQVELWGIPPNRTNPSFTETAQASARMDTVITHADGSFSKGGSFELGLREFETQLVSGSDLLNFADVDRIGIAGTLFAPVDEDFDFPRSRVRFKIAPISMGVPLGVLRTGDTLAYVYTLTAEGTTHGFERGYDAFIGDPFDVDVVTNNLNVTVALASVPEANTSALTLLGIAGLFLWRWHRVRSQCSGPQH